MTAATIAGAIKASLAISIPSLPVYRIEAPSNVAPVLVVYDGLDVSTRLDMPGNLILTETCQVDLYTNTGENAGLPDSVHKALHHAPLSVATGQVYRCSIVSRLTNPTPGNPNDEGITRTTFTLTITRSPA